MTDVAAVPSEEHVRLERERDFLLRSLDDLEGERDKGAIDDDSYERLHADYMARAAAVIRALDAGAENRPVPPVSSRRRVGTALAIIAFVVVTGVALAAALGARLPGQTSSGNTGQATSDSTKATIKARVDRLERAVAADPDDLASRLLLARFLEADGNLAGALKQYDAVLGRNPMSAEAQAQAGRILYLTAQASSRSKPEEAAGLVDAALDRLNRAVEIDPNHADARFFRAIVYANEFGAFAAAQNDLQRYLLLAPDGPFAGQARQLLADVTAAMEGTPATAAPMATKRN